MIRKSVQALIAESHNKMLGYVGMQSFYYSQLCIKHEPASLLPLEIIYLGRTYKFEETARLLLGEGKENEDKMYIYPNDMEYLRPLLEAIYKVHPEFKIDLLTNDVDKDKDDDKANESEPDFGSKNHESSDNEEQNEEGENNKYYYIKLTMPPVTKQQRKVYLDAVDAVHKYIILKIDGIKAKLTAKVAVKTVGSTKEETDEIKATIDDIYDKDKGMADQQKDEKTQEIEDAYQRYLANHPEESGAANDDDKDDDADNSQPAMPEDQAAQDDAQGPQPPQMPKAPDAPANPLEALGFGS